MRKQNYNKKIYSLLFLMCFGLLAYVSCGDDDDDDDDDNAAPSAATIGAPGTFAISEVTPGDSKVTLTWGDSTNAVSYTVKYGTASGEYANEVSTEAKSPYTITKLTNGTAYYFMVTAINTIGSTDATSEVSATLPTWKAESELKGSNSEAGDYFGWSVAISDDTIVVGAYNEDNAQATITNGATIPAEVSQERRSGAAYVFKKDDGVWKQEAYLKASNPEEFDAFGERVSISNDTIVVGAESEDNSQATITNGATIPTEVSQENGSGAAYVFKRTDGVWKQEAYLKASNVGEYDRFGADVAISGDTIVVGAECEDNSQATITNGVTIPVETSQEDDSGAAYVFKRTDGVWKQEAYLKASNSGGGDRFGKPVALSSDTIVVGAVGEDNSQATITNGATIPAETSQEEGSGAAYVFKRTDGTWKQEAYLKASNAGGDDQFGLSVAISGDTIVVGAVGEDSNKKGVVNGVEDSSNDDAGNSGAAYVFKRTDGVWKQEAYLKASNSDAGDYFGIVSISGDTIVVGAVGEGSKETTVVNGSTASTDNSAPGSGAAYVFKRTDGAWKQTAYLKTPLNIPVLSLSSGILGFGISTAISDGTIVVGSGFEKASVFKLK